MGIDGDADTAELSPLTPVTLSSSCSPPKKLQRMVIDESVKMSDLKASALDLIAAFHELKGQHEFLKNEIIEIKKENSDIKTKLNNTTNEKLQADKKARITEFILGFRSLLDYYEKSYFPLWLRENVPDHMTRWKIMFKIEDSDIVQILRNRLEEATIKEANFYIALDVFRRKSNFEHHEGDIPEIKEEDEWKEIFHRLNIKDYSHQRCLQILSRAITKEENDMTWKKKYTRKKTPTALIVKGLPLSHTEADIKELLTENKQPDIISNIVIMEETKSNKTRSSGEAIVFLTSLEEALIIFSKKNGYQFSSSRLSINNPYPLV